MVTSGWVQPSPSRAVAPQVEDGRRPASAQIPVMPAAPARAPGQRSRGGRTALGAALVGLSIAWTGASPLASTRGPPPPLVGHVEADRGPETGGTPVTILGSNFRPGATVTFGEAAALDVAVMSSGRITAVTPPHPAGQVNVSVRNPDGQRGGRAWTFTYLGEGR